MSRTDDNQRTARDRIERLRRRVKEQQQQDTEPKDPVWPILQGMLDLLEDEL